MWANPIHRLRLVSVLEAGAVLLLIAAAVVGATGGPAVAVPLVAAVAIALFAAYAVQVLIVSRLLRWSGWQTLVIVAAGLVPFAPFAIERWLSDQERHVVAA